jgi:hypothetical protein
MNLKNQKRYSGILAKELKQFISQGKRRFYLREIVEASHVPLSDAEDFFIPLLEKNKIEGSLEVRCPTCGAALGTYMRFPEIPEELTCEFCEEDFPRETECLEIVLEVKDKFFRDPENASNTTR